MDLNAEFDQVIQKMNWNEVIDRVKAMVDDMVMGDTPYPSPLLPVPTLPAEMWFSPQPQSVDRQYFGFTPDGAAPYSSIQPPSVDRENLRFFPAPHNSGLNVHTASFVMLKTRSELTVIQRAQVYSQKRLLPNQLPQHIVPGGAASTSSPTAQYHNIPVMRLPETMRETMLPVGELNGEVVFGLPRVPPVPPAAPPVQGPRLSETPDAAAPHSSGHNVHVAPIIPLETQGRTTVIQRAQVYRQKQYHNMSVMRLPETMRETMLPIRALNGEVVYRPPGVPPVPPAAPPVQGPRLSETPDAAAPHSSGHNVQAAPCVPLETQSESTVIQRAQVYSQKQLPQHIVPGGAASTSSPTAQYPNMSVMRLPETMLPVGVLNGEVVYRPPGVPPVPPAAPPVQGPRLSETTMEKMVPVGELNGVKVYGLPGVPLVPPAAPPVTRSKPQTQKPERQEDDGRPHVKKPLNAFMIFRREQSSNVAAELNIKDAASVNTALGQRWKSMSKEQKNEYYRKADNEKLLHILHHPEWSYRDNYGKKRKRVRRKAPAEDSEPEVTQEAKRMCRTPVETALMEASTSSVLHSSPLLSPSSLLSDSDCFPLDQLLPSCLL